MFHELSSETTFAAGFALWGLLVVRAAVQPSVGRFALVGLGIALARADPAGKRSPARVRRVSAPRRRDVEGPRPLGGGDRARGRRPSCRVDRAQRSALRHVGARARRQRDHPLLPRVHHRPHRRTRERRGVTAARRGDAATPADPRSVPVVRRHAGRALPTTGASACTRTSTSSRTRSSGGTPTTASCATRASKGCEHIPGRMRRASSEPSGTSSRRRSSARRDRARHPQPRRIGKPRAAFPCRPRGSPSRPDRWSGSRVRIRASARCGPRPRTGTSSSTTPHSASASARSRRRGTRSSRRFRTVPGTRSSRSASTSSLAGSRGPGCGSSSVSPASRSGDREERRRSSPSLWQASASSS